MGYGQDAINVIRSNRSLLKKRKFKDVKNLFIETSGITELEFKQVSPSELKAIKAGIRADAIRTARWEFAIFGSLALLLLSLIAYLIFQIFNS